MQQERHREAGGQYQTPAEIASARGSNPQDTRNACRDDDDDTDLQHERHEVWQGVVTHHASPSESSSSCWTIRFCFAVSLLSRARCTSNASDAPSNTRSRKSRTMPPIT